PPPPGGGLAPPRPRPPPPGGPPRPGTPGGGKQGAGRVLERGAGAAPRRETAWWGGGRVESAPAGLLRRRPPAIYPASHHLPLSGAPSQVPDGILHPLGERTRPLPLAGLQRLAEAHFDRSRQEVPSALRHDPVCPPHVDRYHRAPRLVRQVAHPRGESAHSSVWRARPLGVDQQVPSRLQELA